MRILRMMLITLILGGLVVSLLGCGSKSDEANLSENQVVTVQRGNLTVDITAAGNLALSRTEDLAFEIAGTVEEVLVQEGDTVEEGQVLARLDTSEWEDELAALGDKLTAAERQVTEAQRQVPLKQLTVREAEINLKDAQRALADAQRALREEPEWIVTEEGQGTVNKEEVEKKEIALERAKLQLEDAKVAVEDAEEAVEDAEKAVEDAQGALNEALDTSLEIIAPFSGFITSVNVSGGDEVKKGTVAVVIADPNKFEADILVSEMDIFQVELGGEAWVEVDALSGVGLPATVTHISPTATIQSGVVNYTVKVEVESLEATWQGRQEAGQEAMEEISSEEMQERLRQAIEEGLITQEQAEEMMERMRSGEFPSPLGGGEGETSAFPSERQVSTIMAEDYQLKEGLTVTVSIIIYEGTDVLLIPNSAITYQGNRAYVQVLLPSGTTEQRAIQIGNTDYQYTEVTSGLDEGEEVVIPQGTSTTTTTTQQQGPRGGVMIPGMGGPR